MFAQDALNAFVYTDGMSTRLFPTRWAHDKPPSLEKFTADFHDDYACAEYLASIRWQKGFECSKCGGNRAWRLEARPWVWECQGIKVDDAGSRMKTGCHHQTSLIAGTVMHGTHLPLRKWFLAAYLMATHSNGISALQLQPKLNVGYKTAWLLLHKLRRAMVDPDRKALSGNIEIDETSVPYRVADMPETGGQGRSPIGKIFMIGAVEVYETPSGTAPGRCRLERLVNIDRESLHAFIRDNTEVGSVLYTDGNTAYRRVPDRVHTVVNLSAPNAPKAHVVLPWIHRVFSNFKRWANGTYHGVREKHINIYANEYVFRWNRRRHFETNIATIFRIGQKVERTTYRDIVGDTTEWKLTYQESIFDSLRPFLRKKVEDYQKEHGVDFYTALEALRSITERVVYARRKPKRPVLPTRRQDDIKVASRYNHPKKIPQAEIASGYLRHVPVNSKITGSRKTKTA